MYNYEISLLLDVDPETAFSLYLDATHMSEWEKGLKQVISTKGNLFAEGSCGELHFSIGTRHMVMGVSVEKRTAPSLVTLIYTIPGAWNRCENHFSSHGKQTLWTMKVTFKFKDYPPAGIDAFKAKTTEAMITYQRFIKSCTLKGKYDEF